MAEASAMVHGSSLVPCSPVMPTHHSGDLISLDNLVLSCESVTSPDGDMDRAYLSTNAGLPVFKEADAPEYTSKKDASVGIVDIDIGEIDHATIAADIYKHLRATEMSKRPSTDFLELVQKDITPRLRAILIDWLSEVVEEFGLTQESLYLSVNYVDRYLSGIEVKPDRLQLLGTACLLIAAKYEEDDQVPSIQEFCCITADTYNKEALLEMESDVLNYLNFDVTVPTTECFLKRYICAALGSLEAPPLLFQLLAGYVAELSLLEYNMVRYKPSMIAASSVFLARSLLQPKKDVWDATLSHYTLYNPSDLFQCVRALHLLLYNSSTGGLDGIRPEHRQLVRVCGKGI